MFGAGLGDEAASSVDGLDNNDSEDGSNNKNDKGFHFNITQATLDQLTKTGLAKEVIQQGDGMEYELGTDGTMDEEKTFSMLGKDVSDDELREAGIVGGSGGGGGSGSVGIPTMWDEQTVPVEEAPGYQKTFDAGNSLAESYGIMLDDIVEREISSSDDENDGVVDVSGPTTSANDEEMETNKDIMTSAKIIQGSNEDTTESEDGKPAKDPIDMLTVARLKEILRAQGLKVSGTKQVLRDRLRNHVNSLLQEEDQ